MTARASKTGSAVQAKLTNGCYDSQKLSPFARFENAEKNVDLFSYSTPLKSLPEFCIEYAFFFSIST